MTDAQLATVLYKALKNKSCNCQRAWGRDGYAVVQQCFGCAAIDHYEFSRLAILDIKT